MSNGLVAANPSGVENIESSNPALSESVTQLINQRTNQSANHLIDQSISKRNNLSIHKAINERLIDVSEASNPSKIANPESSNLAMSEFVTQPINQNNNQSSNYLSLISIN